MRILQHFNLFGFSILLHFVTTYVESVQIEMQYTHLYYYFCITFCLNILVLTFSARIRHLSKIFIYIVLYLAALLDVACYFITGSNLSPDITQTILETNIYEVNEFLSSQVQFSKILMKLSPILILASFNIFMENSATDIIKWKIPMIKGIVIGGSCAICTIIALNFHIQYSSESFLDEIEINWDRYVPKIALPRLLLALGCNIRQTARVNQLISINERIKETNCNRKECDIVLIIGESYNKYHSQLYGYELCTTPFQVKRYNDGELIVFKNATTTSNLTAQAVKQMLANHTSADNESWWTVPWFPAIFRKAGYKTCFFSNQQSDIGVTNLAQYNIGSIMQNPILKNQLFDYTNQQRYNYDEGLLEELKHSPYLNSDKCLYVFHLMGQHFSYKNRYPKSRKKFFNNDYNRNDLSEAEVAYVAQYDNAIAYNDSVVDAIICHFNSKNAAVLYLSDHGEEIFDDLHVMGRTFSEINIYSYRNEFEIPFWIWFSESYRHENKTVIADIKEKSKMPFRSDGLSKIILQLAGIIYPQ